MALKPTIYKTHVALSDIDRNIYADFDLTLAQHPSESLERMAVRVLAYCASYQERLAFSKGLSTPDEPALWAHALNGDVLQWIDVGEPAPERIKKACTKSQAVAIYSFNSKSEVWWTQARSALAALNVSVFRFLWPEIQALATSVTRNMDIQVTITSGMLYISFPDAQHAVTLERLQ